MRFQPFSTNFYNFNSSCLLNVGATIFAYYVLLYCIVPIFAIYMVARILYFSHDSHCFHYPNFFFTKKYKHSLDVQLVGKTNGVKYIVQANNE